MLYDYAELNDETRIAHSEVLEDGTIKIGIERPVENGFDSAWCHMPALEWESVEGFTTEELNRLKRYLINNAPLIWRFARELSEVDEVA